MCGLREMFALPPSVIARKRVFVTHSYSFQLQGLCVSSRGPSLIMCVIFSLQSLVDVSRATPCAWVHDASMEQAD